MEDLFEFLFGASGRINRAKYWRSTLLFTVAGLMAAVILFTAAGIAAPLFIIMVVLVLVPWLLWGLSITTERLHDRDKSAWWLVVFYLVPGALGQFAKAAWVAGQRAQCCITSWRWRVLRSRSGDSSKSAAYAAPPARTHTDPTRFRSLDGGAERPGSKTKKSPAAVRPPGEFRMLGNTILTCTLPIPQEGTTQTFKLSSSGIP